MKMNRKRDLANLGEVYGESIVNEMLAFGPGAGRSASPSPSTPTAVVIKKEEEQEDHLPPINTEDSETEASMAKSELYKIHKASRELYNIIKDCSDLEPWVFSKITVAASYLEGVKNYLEYDKFKKEGEFGTDLEGAHQDNIVSRVKEMLHGEKKEVLEQVIRQVIFNLEALKTIQEDSK